MAEFHGYTDVAVVLAKASMTEDSGDAIQATTLPPAPWHTAIFAQVCTLTAEGGLASYFAVDISVEVL